MFDYFYHYELFLEKLNNIKFLNSSFKVKK